MATQTLSSPPSKARRVSGPVLLYDGTCGFCAASVQFLLRHERVHTLRFAPLDGAFAATVRARHPALDGVDSLVWVEADGSDGAGAVLVRSAAVLRAAQYLGGVWTLARAAALLPRSLRDAAYDLIARHRHRILPKQDQCFLPPPEVRGRFLE